MGIQLGIGLTGQRLNASPARLFSVTGSRGFMFDLSDYSTQFQDTAGTVPITSTSQSVGLMLDLSQGLALGANLLVGSWTLTVDGGAATATESPAGTLNLTGDGVNGANARQSFATIAGRTYRISCSVAGSTTTVQVGTGSGGSDLLPITALPVGSREILFVATTATSHITFRKAGAALSSISGITIRELAGNHATQGTAGNRPLTTTIGAGFRGIQFDGTDDWLQTAAIDFSNSDEVTVVAGVRKLSDAARGMIAECGTPGGAASFALDAAPFGGVTYRFNSIGGAGTGSATTALGVAPDSAVLTGIGDISGDLSRLRRNAAVGTDGTSDQGTGNYSNAIVYIGRRGGTSLPFNGVLTFLFAINRLLTANELASVEAYANSRTGAF